jgi:hypothetical protein
LFGGLGLLARDKSDSFAVLVGNTQYIVVSITRLWKAENKVDSNSVKRRWRGVN